MKAKLRHIKLSFGVAKVAVRKVLAKQRMKPNFGNGGAVDNLLAKAISNFELRTKGLSLDERLSNRLLTEDFYTEPKYFKNPEAIFDDLIGCDKVREKIHELQALVDAAKQEGRDPLDDMELTFMFVGPPGTGKTTVARRMGQLFASLGVLGSSDFKQVSASDFTTGYVGQAARKTRDIFREALGGVLFIDEAYRLYDRSRASFMQEAVDEIVNMLTEDEFRGKMFVIFAGYEREVLEMMNHVNPGLKSRVTNKIQFEAFDAGAAASLLLLRLKEKRLEISREVEAKLVLYARRLVNAPQWSSGRDVDTWSKRIIVSCAKSKARIVSQQHLESALQSMILDKTGARAVDEELPGSDSNSGPLFANAHLHSTAPKFDVTFRDLDEVEDFEIDSGHGDDEDPIWTALQEACVALGYDTSRESRQKLAEILKGITEGDDFDEDIIQYVRKKTGSTRENIEAALRPQVPAFLYSIEAANQYEENRSNELAQMAEKEREEEIARDEAFQEKLRGMCPAGYHWYREGTGWRCGGGTHYVEGDP